MEELDCWSGFGKNYQGCQTSWNPFANGDAL